MQRRDLLRGGSIALALAAAGCTSDTEDVEDSTGNGNGEDGGNGNGNGNGDTEDTSDESDGSEDGAGEDGGNGGNGDDGNGDGNGGDDLTDDNESEGENDSEGESEDGTDGEDGGDDSDGNGGNGASGEPAIETVEEELVVEEGEFSTEAYVDARVENSGDAASGMIELTADWYDGDENYLDNDSAYLQTLPAGEVWNPHVRFLGSDAEAVEDYELNGEFELEPIDFDPEGLDLVDDELMAGEDEIEVRGEVENNTGDEVGYIQAIATFYNADGEIIGDDRANVTDVPDSESWSFTIAMLEHRRVDEVEDYQVRIADSAW